MFFKKKDKQLFDGGLLMCPRCRIKMQKLKKGDVIIDVCGKCGGMWLDQIEVKKLVSMANDLKKGDKHGKK